MLFSFLVTLREGFEIALIVAIVLGYLARTGNRQAFGPVWAGVGFAAVVTVAVSAALVVGGECGYRALRAGIAGATPDESQQDDLPHLHLKPKDHLFHTIERARGLTMPIGLYAIIESALRHFAKRVEELESLLG